MPCGQHPLHRGVSPGSGNPGNPGFPPYPHGAWATGGGVFPLPALLPVRISTPSETGNSCITVRETLRIGRSG